MPGYYFDDFNVGDEFVTPTRTITETDVVMFAAMTGDYNELHTSAEYMKDTQFKQRLVHGLLGLSVSHGLLFRLGLLEGTAIAFLGIESWQFKAPMYFGDTIHVRVKVTEARASQSKPDRGIVKLYLEIVKQDGTVAQSGYKSIMMKRRAKGA
ncbi:MAG: MaoC family dehydratase N-terminal domain-containing protein [Desulfobacterales bacterium]|nr:MAG: MaoC family dehydratase N-terminal domain-containing protein [Desulfobacterales bacterium]